ncbi:hypothetical protein BsWGS_24676 [Bradybaena similaris]
MAELVILSLNIRGMRTKLQHIHSLSQIYRPDYILLQETNIHSHSHAKHITTQLGLQHSDFSLAVQRVGTGTCILQTSDRWEIVRTHRDDQGSTNIIQITNNIHTYTIANIHAPPNRRNQPSFYDKLDTLLADTFRGQNLILAGDFNCVLTEKDVIGGTVRAQLHKVSGESFTQLDILSNIIDTHSLTDAFRHIHPNSTETTHKDISINRSARIDRFYTPITHHISRCRHLPETLDFTDHKGVLLEISPKNTQTQPSKRSPHWKFNNTLLQDTEFVHHMTNLLQLYTDTTPDTNITEHWELLKDTICARTKRLASITHNIRLQQEEITQAAIRQAKQSNNNSPHLHILENELEQQQQHKYRGALIRTKLNTITQETPSKQYMGIEQNIHRSRQISEIVDMQGNTHTDTTQITDAFQQYYTKLYTAEPVSTEIQDRFLQNCKKLSETEKEALNTELTLTDITQAVQHMQKNKTPGPDGLTIEFYQHFFPILGPLLLKVYHESFHRQTLPSSYNTSFITLIPKQNTDSTQLQNYRPISLLNTDYKILTKTLTNKLKPFMATLVHTDQQCSVPHRNIHQHTYFIRDIIQYTHEKDCPSSLLSLDQEKAFDRISHQYLHKTLKHCNVGDHFERWVRILYQSPESRILANHSLSGAFRLTRSVRQGCPLSPLLYVLTLETVLAAIRADTNIKGTFIQGMGEKKLCAYADDTVLFPSTDTSITKILHTFELYGRGSGAKINVGKTTIMGLGKWKQKSDFPPELTRTQQTKVYGITFPCDPNKTHTRTWQTLLQKIQDMLERYRHKTTTIFGRATLVNTYIIPKIIYLATTLNPPKQTITDINKHVRAFIFKNTINNIKHQTLMQRTCQGGIGLQDIHTKIQALRISYIRNIITHPQQNTLALYYIGIRLHHIKRIDNAQPHHYGITPPFYKTCLRALKGNENLVKQTTTQIYKHLVQKQAPPLLNRIKWFRQLYITDHTPTFSNLHHRLIPAQSREICYRLLYNTTPIIKRLKNRHQQTTLCTLCNTRLENNTQTHEMHLFYLCRTIRDTREKLKQLLQTHSNKHIDLFKAIFANTICKTSPETQGKLLSALAAYRAVIWRCSFSAKHHHRTYTPTIILHLFLHKTTQIFGE